MSVVERPRVLVVDDDDSLREALVSTLDEAGYAVREADGISSALSALRQLKPQALLLDIRLRDGDGLALLGELRALHPELPVIMATAYSDSERTIAAMRDGAFEYVTKPFDYDGLLATIARAVRVPVRASRETTVPEQGLVGRSAAMLQVWKAIGRAAASSAPVLITGEAGVGKERIARAIHEHGPHAQRAFVVLDHDAIARKLLAAEPIGDGTLFLDEIAELEPSLQARLARMIEQGAIAARIIAASSHSVMPRTEGATLREELYYRLGVVRIDVPPLRERRQDVPLLVEAFLHEAGHARRALSEAAMRRLVTYDWPGNVRELRHVLEAACVMSSAEVLDLGDLGLPAQPVADDGDGEGDDLRLAPLVARTERRAICRALELAKGNRARAARLLGIRRALLYTRMHELDIVVDE